MATTVIDTLVTRFQLDDGSYVAGVNRAQGATARLDGSVSKAQAAIKALSADASAAGAAIGESLATGITAVVTAIVALGVASVKLALDNRRLEDSFRGVLGSADRVKQMMGFLREESNKTGFSKEDLGGAARQMMMQGMDVNPWLPAAEKLAAGAGQMNGGGLNWAADLISKARAGEFDRVMSSSGMGQAGITKGDLAAAGAKFDRNAQFEGTADEFLRVFKQVIDQKLSGTLAGMTGGIEQKWSQMVGSMQDALVPIGEMLLEFFTPLVTIISDASKSLVPFMNGLTSIFGSGGKGGSMNAGLQVVEHQFNLFVDHMVSGVYQIVAASGHITDLIWHTIKGDIPQIGKDIQQIGKEAQGMFNKYLADKYSNGPSAPTPGASPEDPAKRRADHMAILGLGGPVTLAHEIARNTRATAEGIAQLVDLKSFIFGGGDIGKLGVSREEYSRRGGGHHSIELTINGDKAAGSELLQKLSQQGFRLQRA